MRSIRNLLIAVLLTGCSLLPRAVSAEAATHNSVTKKYSTTSSSAAKLPRSTPKGDPTELHPVKTPAGQSELNNLEKQTMKTVGQSAKQSHQAATSRALRSSVPQRTAPIDFSYRSTATHQSGTVRHLK